MSHKEHLVIRPIRRGNAAEEKCVVALVNRCYRTKENWTNEADLVTGDRVNHEQLTNAMKEFDIFVVEDITIKKIVACAKTGITKGTVIGPLHEPAGYIGMVAVAPEYQSKGLGSRLFTFAEDRCEGFGMKTMALDVLDVRDDIVEWYERRGYKRSKRSMDAAPFMKQNGERLLKPSSFILLIKRL